MQRVLKSFLIRGPVNRVHSSDIAPFECAGGPPHQCHHVNLSTELEKNALILATSDSGLLWSVEDCTTYLLDTRLFT